MKKDIKMLSVFIEELQSELKRHGDMPVYAFDEYSTDDYPSVYCAVDEEDEFGPHPNRKSMQIFS